ncbi:eukaryotic mitochondrial regulator protein-domain-containing protein [Geopyxis carbonaria]|nr:eukaryotic mitochondrial regulator protein-domain-containing protein [Geopyxis carbonaria]
MPRIPPPTSTVVHPSKAALSLSRSRRPLSTTVPRRAQAADDDDPTLGSAREDEIRKLKADYRAWLRGPGENFKKPLYNEMNYLTSYDTRTWERKSERGSMNVPFPLNPHFRSAPVLSEELKNEIHRRVMAGQSVRRVSAHFSVTMERVAAVVRLKEVEKQWVKDEKPLATYLTKALHTMIPTTPLAPSQQPQTFHESIMDIPSHPFSHRQTFLPASESREFTRADAGKEFGLPPAEEAVPHPDLLVLQRERELGLDREERVQRQKERERREAGREADEARKKREALKKMGEIVEVGRWQWRLQEAQTGRVGFRYGVPHEDRKKGQVKIPRRVE